MCTTKLIRKNAKKPTNEPEKVKHKRTIRNFAEKAMVINKLKIGLTEEKLASEKEPLLLQSIGLNKKKTN